MHFPHGRDWPSIRETGMKGANFEPNKELRRAELDMDRYTSRVVMVTSLLRVTGKLIKSSSHRMKRSGNQGVASFPTLMEIVNSNDR